MRLSALLLLLDLTSMCNMVEHNLLTHQLANVGTWGTALQWIFSFLHGPEHRVALVEKMPQENPLECDVLQEVILPQCCLISVCIPLLGLPGSMGWWYLALSLDGWMPGFCPVILKRALQAMAERLQQMGMWDWKSGFQLSTESCASLGLSGAEASQFKHHSTPQVKITSREARGESN